MAPPKKIKKTMRQKYRNTTNRVNSNFKEALKENDTIFKSSDSETAMEVETCDVPVNFNDILLNSEDSNSVVTELLSQSSQHSNDVPDEPLECETFKDFLQNWAVTRRVPLSAVTDLLKGMKTFGVCDDLPMDARTLLGTPRSGSSFATPKFLAGGKYIYFGLKNGIIKAIKNGGLKEKCLNFQDGVVKINLCTNIDGVPLDHSTSKCLWPISSSVIETVDNSPFCAALYYGLQKPTCFQVLWQDFVSEALELHATPFEVEGIFYQLEFNGPFICDSPAKSDLKGIAHHNAYFSCDWCPVEGVWRQTVVFPCDGTMLPLRTDEEFRQQSQPQHHNSESALLALPINMIWNFPIDYMHAVLLGVMKRLLSLWLIRTNVNKLSANGRKLLGENLQNVHRHIPIEFARKSRDLKFFPKFKATEFRQFLLYTGPVVLINILPLKLYNHFLLFHVAIRILASDMASDEQYVDYSEKLLVKFVVLLQKYYGKRHMVSCVHGMLHLAECCRKYGNLDNFSAFKFESFLGRLKCLVRSPKSPIVQVCNRYQEMVVNEEARSKKEVKYVEAECNMQHKEGPIIKGQFQEPFAQFKQLKKSGFDVRTNSPNNCVILVNGNVSVVENIIRCESKIHVLCRHFQVIKDFYTKPCKSTDLNVCVASQLGELEKIDYKQISAKCVYFPLREKGEDKFIIFPLLHSL